VTVSDTPYVPTRRAGGGMVERPEAPTSLADILERVLDKGIVIAGDIQINLLDIELLTIKLRLLVASVDKAKEMGINWWEGDSTLSSDARELEDENRELRERLNRLEERLELMSPDERESQEAGRGE
jgi:DNA anti-recombination protein RmuC